MTHGDDCYIADCGAHDYYVGVVSSDAAKHLYHDQHDIDQRRAIMEVEKDEVARVGSLHRATREDVEIDQAAEQRLVRKLDLNIIPIVMLLYLFSFLDRQVIH